MHTLDVTQVSTAPVPVNGPLFSHADTYTDDGGVMSGGVRTLTPPTEPGSSAGYEHVTGRRKAEQNGEVGGSNPPPATPGTPCYCGRPPGRRHDDLCPAKPQMGRRLVPLRTDAPTEALTARRTIRRRRG